MADLSEREISEQFRCDPPEDFKPWFGVDGNKIICIEGDVRLGFEKTGDEDKDANLIQTLRKAVWQFLECRRLGLSLPGGA